MCHLQTGALLLEMEGNICFYYTMYSMNIKIYKKSRKC